MIDNIKLTEDCTDKNFLGYWSNNNLEGTLSELIQWKDSEKTADILNHFDMKMIAVKVNTNINDYFGLKIKEYFDTHDISIFDWIRNSRYQKNGNAKEYYYQDELVAGAEVINPDVNPLLNGCTKLEHSLVIRYY